MGIARKYKAIVARPKQPSLTGLILEKVAEAGEVLLNSFFPAKYPEARMWRKILGLDASYEFKHTTFSSILARLQAQGLVECRRRGRQTYWRLTTAGRGVTARQTPAAPPQIDGKTRLVCFDIPERERAKRRWLRGELIALGYRPLQKSVWIGDAPLPQDFMASLDTLDLRGAVHVLMVASQGTLTEL